MTTADILKGFLDDFRGITPYAAYRCRWEREAAKQIYEICAEMPPDAARAYCADQAREIAASGDLYLADIYEKAGHKIRWAQERGEI